MIFSERVDETESGESINLRQEKQKVQLPASRR